MLLLAHLFGPACRLARYETMTARRTGQTMPAQTCLASTTAKTLLPRLTNRRRARTIGGMAAHTGRLCVLPWFIPHSTPSRNLVGGFWNAGKQERLFSRHPPGCLLSASSTQHIPWDLFGDLRILQLLFPREVVLSAKHVFVHGKEPCQPNPVHKLRILTVIQ